jgi:allophanate hydrolase
VTVAAARGGLARTARDSVDAAHRVIDAGGRSGIWIDLVDRDLARRRADDIDARLAAGETLPLAGTTLAVKGNIDVEGLDTTAGCRSFAYRPERSAAAVRALVEAGTVVVGTTNLDQFATGLVGTRSPFGVCPNAHWADLISGGSSSGSAVAVAAGMVDLSLGTDTAGSGRVPAAANGIVGIKPTRGRISTAGVVPACASIDCVSVFARDVDLAARAASIMAATSPDPDDPWSRAPTPFARSGPLRLGLPEPTGLDFDGDADGPGRHRRAVESFLDAVLDGVSPPPTSVEVGAGQMADLVSAGRLLYDGAFVAERYAAVGPFVEAHPDDVDPVVGRIIRDAGTIPAWRFAADLSLLAGHRARCRELFHRVDVLVVPSVPRVPTVDEVRAEPVAVNSMLGRYTNFVNLLDLCALTLPVPEGGADRAGPPPSLTLIAPAWADDLLVSLAATVRGGSASRR